MSCNKGLWSLEAARNQSPQWPHARTTATDHMPGAPTQDSALRKRPHPGPPHPPAPFPSPHFPSLLPYHLLSPCPQQPPGSRATPVQEFPPLHFLHTPNHPSPLPAAVPYLTGKKCVLPSTLTLDVFSLCRTACVTPPLAHRHWRRGLLYILRALHA